MNCPVCGIPLTRTEYEGFRAFVCSNGHGHAVERMRMDGIRRKRETSDEQLSRDHLRRQQPDSADELRCPRCQQAMAKEPQNNPFEFLADRCRYCDLYWLDGGELELMQMNYELSAKGRMNARHQARVRRASRESSQQPEPRQSATPVDPPESDARAGDGVTAEGFWSSLFGGVAPSKDPFYD